MENRKPRIDFQRSVELINAWLDWSRIREQTSFNFRKSTNLIHIMNRIEKKNYVIMSINIDKAFDKLQYPFMKKTLTN